MLRKCLFWLEVELSELRKAGSSFAYNKIELSIHDPFNSPCALQTPATSSHGLAHANFQGQISVQQAAIEFCTVQGVRHALRLIA